MERAKRFEPPIENSEAFDYQIFLKSSKSGYTQIHAQISEEAERLQVYAAWPYLPIKVREAILSQLDFVLEVEEGLK
jgi:hypothetical protein